VFSPFLFYFSFIIFCSFTFFHFIFCPFHARKPGGTQKEQLR
jgi:hypothetical protein